MNPPADLPARLRNEVRIAKSLTATHRQVMFIVGKRHPPAMTLEDYAHYRRDEAAYLSTAVHDITGTQPRDITQFCRDYADAFRSR